MDDEYYIFANNVNKLAFYESRKDRLNYTCRILLLDVVRYLEALDAGEKKLASRELQSMRIRVADVKKILEDQ